jgi:hypothetical protein
VGRAKEIGGQSERKRSIQKHTQIRRKVLFKNDQKHKFLLHMTVMTTITFERRGV